LPGLEYGAGVSFLSANDGVVSIATGLGYNYAMGLEQRTRARRVRIVAHRAADYADAEAWDLDFWLAMTPQERLSALVAIRRDVEKVRAAGGHGADFGDDRGSDT
jgi:hypothetical protein